MTTKSPAMADIPYRLVTARQTLTYTFEASCFIDPALVKPWEAYTEAERDEFEAHGPIPCEGGFLPGLWCEDCRFGKCSPMEEEP